MIFTKKIAIIIVIISLILFLSSCVSTGSGSGRLSLMEAIEKSAEKISQDLPSGSRIVITAFESESEGLSEYVIEELISSLIFFNVEVVDRENLDYVYREINFQISGDVSDETAVTVGKFLGAQFLITGQLINTGSAYRLRTSATYMGQATRVSVSSFNIHNDDEMQALVTALADQTSSARTANYRTNEQITPQTAGTFLDRGILFARRGDFVMAISDFTEAIRLNSNLTAAYILRGRAIFASVSTVLIVEGNFNDVRVSSTMGRTSANQARNYDLAIEDFTKAIELDPYNASAYRERGRVYAQKGDYNSSISDYDRAIQINPNFSAAYNNRGNSHSFKRDYEKAIADFDRAIEINPNFADAYYNRALVHIENRSNDLAIADLEEVLRLNPNDREARRDLDTLRRQRRR